MQLWFPQMNLQKQNKKCLINKTISVKYYPLQKKYWIECWNNFYTG